MTAVSVKSQLCCWALTALQMTHDNIDTSPLVKSICNTLDKSLHSAAATHPNNNNNNNNNNNSDDSNPSTPSENTEPVFTRAEVTNHCSFDSCWVIVNNKVYDVTRFLRSHPGGEDIIMEYAGCDATSVFIDKGHSRDAYEMLSEYFIGRVVDADWLPEKQTT